MSGTLRGMETQTLKEEYFDPRLLAAQKLLMPPVTRRYSVLYPLLASAGMASASLIFALSVILGPGWDMTGPRSEAAMPMVKNAAERISEQPVTDTSNRVQNLARASEFELSSTPDEVAISASEADGLSSTIRN